MLNVNYLYNIILQETGGSSLSIVDVTESSEDETESESEFTTFDDCVKCVCQDECDTGFMIQVHQIIAI